MWKYRHLFNVKVYNTQNTTICRSISRVKVKVFVARNGSAKANM